MAKRNLRSREILRVIRRRRPGGIGETARQPCRTLQVLTQSDNFFSALIPSSRTAQTVRDPAIGQCLHNLPCLLHELGRGPSLALGMTRVRGAAIPLWAASDCRIFRGVSPARSPENLQTASRETIVSSGFKEREKRQRHR